MVDCKYTQSLKCYSYLKECIIYILFYFRYVTSALHLLPLRELRTALGPPRVGEKLSSIFEISAFDQSSLHNYPNIPVETTFLGKQL